MTTQKSSTWWFRWFLESSYMHTILRDEEFLDYHLSASSESCTPSEETSEDTEAEEVHTAENSSTRGTKQQYLSCVCPLAKPNVNRLNELPAQCLLMWIHLVCSRELSFERVNKRTERAVFQWNNKDLHNFEMEFARFLDWRGRLVPVFRISGTNFTDETRYLAQLLTRAQSERGSETTVP